MRLEPGKAGEGGLLESSTVVSRRCKRDLACDCEFFKENSS